MKQQLRIGQQNTFSRFRVKKTRLQSLIPEFRMREKIALRSKTLKSISRACASWTTMAVFSLCLLLTTSCEVGVRMEEEGKGETQSEENHEKQVDSAVSSERAALEKVRLESAEKTYSEIDKEYLDFYDTFFEEIDQSKEPEQFEKVFEKWALRIEEKWKEDPKKFSMQTFLIGYYYKQKRINSVQDLRRHRVLAIILSKGCKDTVYPHLFSTFIEEYDAFSDTHRYYFSPFFHASGEESYRARFFPFKSMEDINKIPPNYLEFLLDRDAWNTLQEFATVFPESLKLEELEWAKELYQGQEDALHWWRDLVLQNKRPGEIRALAEKLDVMLQSPHWPIQFWALKTISAFSRLREREYTYPTEKQHPLVMRQVEVLELLSSEKGKASNTDKPYFEMEEEYLSFYDTLCEEVDFVDDWPEEMVEKWIPLISAKWEKEPKKFSLQTLLVLDYYVQEGAKTASGVLRTQIIGIMLRDYLQNMVDAHLFPTFIEEYNAFSEYQRELFSPLFHASGGESYRARFFPLKSMEDINKIPPSYLEFLMERDAWNTLKEFSTVFPRKLKLKKFMWARDLYCGQGGNVEWVPDTVLQHKKEAEIAALADKLNTMLESPHWPIQFWALRTIRAFSKLKERDYTYPSENLHPLLKRQLEALKQNNL